MKVNKILFDRAALEWNNIRIMRSVINSGIVMGTYQYVDPAAVMKESVEDLEAKIRDTRRMLDQAIKEEEYELATELNELLKQLIKKLNSYEE
jgi:protein-arginine kinase activator protein McsA